MKIRELYIKSFGKFSDKKIVLQDGIHVFYGENESGKTTIHTFIKSMLFGMERGRGRASVNDTYSLYQPWDMERYEGTLKFESGGKNFCLSRDFGRFTKSASLICEDDGEEFSLEHGDLEMLLGGLDAANYENTVAVGQMKIETNQSLAAELQNYVTNYYSTGNSDIDLDGAITQLQGKRKDTEKEIRAFLQQKQQRRQEVEQEKSYIWKDIHKLEEDLEKLDEQIEIQKEKLDEMESQEVKKWRVHPGEIAAVLIGLILIVTAVPGPWNYLIAIVLALAEGMFVWNRLKDGKRDPHNQMLTEAQDSLERLTWQKEHLQSECKEKQTEYGNLQEQMEEEEEENEEYERKNVKLRALELAIENLLTLSKDVHKELSVSLNQKASEILKEITGGKYEMLLIDEKLKMSLYANDRKISLEQVSRGTIEQIYFALRMAASEILHEEEFPVILDDTFVYYDDQRLENTLRWLLKNKKQVLIFTCQKREEEILNKIR